jgi:hypothetical protein
MLFLARPLETHIEGIGDILGSLGAKPDDRAFRYES